jgi:hypothetical protein
MLATLTAPRAPTRGARQAAPYEGGGALKALTTHSPGDITRAD